MYAHSIGFGLAVTWLWLFYLEGPLLTFSADLWHKNPEELFRWFMCSSWLTYLILAKGIRLRSMLDKKWALTICAVILSLCPLLTFTLPKVVAEWSVKNPAVASLLAAAGGAALASFLTAWMQTFVLRDLRGLGLSFAVAITIASTLTMLAGIVDSYWMLAFTVLCPLISLAVLLRQTNTLDSRPLAPFPEADMVNPFSAKIIMFIVLFYLTGGTVFSIINIEHTFPAMFYFSNVSYAAACLIAGISLYHYPDMDLRFVYRPVLPLMALGFLLFSFQENNFAMLSFILLQGGLALFDMYTWLLFPYFARFSTRPAAVCAFGLFLTTFSVFSGNQIVTVIPTMISGSLSVKDLTFVAGVLSVLSVLIFHDRKETFAGWQAVLMPDRHMQQPQPMPNQELSLNLATKNNLEIARFSPLTEREKTVLALLLKGRSGRFISETLNISANTVKFHTRNIYDKLGVSNRQELLTLFENSGQTEDESSNSTA